MSIKIIRFTANGIITLLSILIIVSRLMSFSTSSEYWLWAIPALLIAVLDIYFLTKSMLREPKGTDTSLAAVLISVSASMGSLLSALVISYPVVEFAGQIILRDFGKVIALLPYPFILWSLLCLKDCLTVIPEAHAVVAHGIYKYSRHPLYICYIVWAIANMMMFPSWPMLAVSIGHIAILIMRFKREEELLLATFPEYRDYYSKTGLIGKWRFTFMVGE